MRPVDLYDDPIRNNLGLGEKTVFLSSLLFAFCVVNESLSEPQTGRSISGVGNVEEEKYVANLLAAAAISPSCLLGTARREPGLAPPGFLRRGRGGDKSLRCRLRLLRAQQFLR